MSHTLFKSQNILVKGDKYSYTTAIDKGNPIAGNKTITGIELDFTFMVNGKIANFHEMFPLKEETETSGQSCLELSRWYTLVNVLASMGYYLTETKSDYISEDDIFSKSIIESWIDKIFQPGIEVSQ